VQALNQWALESRLNITKISYGVLPRVLDNYLLLNSGSALGSGVGPLLIKGSLQTSPKWGGQESVFNIEDHLIAIPGEHTTAHLLFTLAYPNAKNKIFLRYDEIEDFVLEGKGLGVIIHENRFTYQDKGLKKITDLGDYWEKETGKPIPLGGIVAQRSLGQDIIASVDGLIHKSIAYAYENHYKELAPFVKMHAQEMNETVMRKHIDLYVNKHSLALDATGKEAVQKLLSVYQSIHPHTEIKQDVFFV